MLYTLLETAKLNGMNPRAYLPFALQRIAEQPIARLDPFQPWNYPRELAHDDQLAA